MSILGDFTSVGWARRAFAFEDARDDIGLMVFLADDAFSLPIIKRLRRSTDAGLKG
jgi:hypothetical protein